MTGEIYVLNSIACDASKYLLDLKKGELEKKFPPFFMHLVEVSVTEGEETAKKIEGILPELKKDSVYCEEMEEGGILNALWYMAEACATGFEIGLKKIPIDQQTVEVLEMYDINPYYARSRGTWLALTDDPAGFESVLHRAQIPYGRIGTANDTKKRTILNGESVRYLDRPQREELEKLNCGGERPDPA